jgi:predicted dehydrogenase
MAQPPVRVGVVGTTTYAETHMARLAAHPDAALAAIAGRDRGRAEAVAQKYGIPAVHSGYEQLLADDDLDAIVIMAPDALHGPIALEAFARGRHVMCEKPLATSSHEARRMADAAAESGLVALSYFFLRSSPAHQHLRHLIDDGYLGDVREASIALQHGFFGEEGDYNWRFDAHRGGGVIADLGCYVFDLARWLVGDIDAVAAHGATQVNRRHPEGRSFEPAFDAAVGLLSFAGGAHGTFTTSVQAHIGPGMQENIVHLEGSRGRLELRHTFAGASLRGIRAGQDDFEDLVIPPAGSFTDGDAEFIDAITGATPVSSTFENGWRVQLCVEAAEQAARSGAWVRVGQEAA